MPSEHLICSKTILILDKEANKIDVKGSTPGTLDTAECTTAGHGEASMSHPTGFSSESSDLFVTTPGSPASPPHNQEELSALEARAIAKEPSKDADSKPSNVRLLSHKAAGSSHGVVNLDATRAQFGARRRSSLISSWSPKKHNKKMTFHPDRALTTLEESPNPVESSNIATNQPVTSFGEQHVGTDKTDSDIAHSNDSSTAINTGGRDSGAGASDLDTLVCNVSLNDRLSAGSTLSGDTRVRNNDRPGEDLGLAPVRDSVTSTASSLSFGGGLPGDNSPEDLLSLLTLEEQDRALSDVSPKPPPLPS